MDRLRRAPHEIAPGQARPAAGPGRRPQTLNEEILDLQSTAGNRSVASAIGETAVQRDPKPAAAAKNDGGVLTFDSGEVLPLQTVTWSVTQKIAQDTHGKSRWPTAAVPFKLEFGNLEITRLPDANSPRADEVIDAKEHDHATLTLNQASADGGLPAEKFELDKVGISRISENKGDDLTEHVTVYVGHMAIAGQVKDDSKAAKARAVAHFQLDGGRPTPVLSWEQSPVSWRKATGDEGTFRRRTRVQDELFTLTIRIPAGELLNRLAATLEGASRFNATLTPIDGRSELDLKEMLVEEIKSSSFGPGVVEVKLVAEISRLRRMP